MFGLEIARPLPCRSVDISQTTTTTRDSAYITTHTTCKFDRASMLSAFCQEQTRTIAFHYSRFILLAIGRPLIYLPVIHLANAFPLQPSPIMNPIHCAFDAKFVPWYIRQLADVRLVVGKLLLCQA